MKKNVCLILIIVTISFVSCGYGTGPEIPITNQDMFPSKDLSGRFALMPHPTNPNDTILGIVKRGDNPDYSTFVALRDCWTNELVSCVDSLGNLKDTVVLCFNFDMETTWENVNSENPIYENEEGKEYYIKIYVANRKYIDYRKQAYKNTIEVDMEDWRRYFLDLMVENKKQQIEIMGNQHPSYRVLHMSINGIGN